MSPSAFRKGYTSLISKTGENTAALDRPISVYSTLARMYHRIIATRILGQIKLSPRQKAFMPGDGLTENIWLLRYIIGNCQRKRTPLCATFVDISKAFDSVSR
jgi:Reverse transcriptase (RNA-dependent DNA polymerase)